MRNKINQTHFQVESGFTINSKTVSTTFAHKHNLITIYVIPESVRLNSMEITFIDYIITLTKSAL